MENVQTHTQAHLPQHLLQQEYWPLHWRLSKYLYCKLIVHESLIAWWLQHPTGVWKVMVQFLLWPQIFSFFHTCDMINIACLSFHC